MITKMLNTILPTVRVFLCQDGRIHERLNLFICTAVPRVGDHIDSQGEALLVRQVRWCIDEPNHKVQYVDVYVVQEGEYDV